MNLTPRALHLWLAACLLLLTGLFLFAGSRASVIVDGTRYHFLDDDQMISMLLNYNPMLHYGAALLMNPTFLAEYREQPVPVSFLMDYNAVFVHAGSRELARFSQWDAPLVRYP